MAELWVAVTQKRIVTASPDMRPSRSTAVVDGITNTCGMIRSANTSRTHTGVWMVTLRKPLAPHVVETLVTWLKPGLKGTRNSQT